MFTKHSHNILNPIEPIPLNDVSETETVRFSLGMPGLDRLTGGGIVKGALTLIGGDPGIGKSTLLLQISQKLANPRTKVLYICGEESILQTSLRAGRLGIRSSDILLFSETNFEIIRDKIVNCRPSVLIIDSIQIMYDPLICSSPGSVSQVKEITSQLLKIAKRNEITTFVIGHVTKSGDIAGPKVLEHLVDTVLYFEGDSHLNYRMIRSIKNRFGPTNELALFVMQELGLIEIVNPSAMFLKERNTEFPGSAIVPVAENSRTILVEIQALVSNSPYSNPSRKTSGFDQNRLALLLAVMEKRAKLYLHDKDVFLSIAGGLKIIEPSADLGALLSVASSLTGKIINPGFTISGEVGLGGEIRNVSGVEQRLKESILMGFSTAVLPQGQVANIPDKIKKEIEIIGVKNIKDALKFLSF